MPTYEYECARCGHTFEKFHSISATPPKRCPECRGKLNRKIGTGAGLIFKGSGFYITDYRSDSYKQASKAESGSGSEKTKPESKQPATGKAESKKAPAAK